MDGIKTNVVNILHEMRKMSIPDRFEAVKHLRTFVNTLSTTLHLSNMQTKKLLDAFPGGNSRETDVISIQSLKRTKVVKAPASPHKQKALPQFMEYSEADLNNVSDASVSQNAQPPQSFMQSSVNSQAAAVAPSISFREHKIDIPTETQQRYSQNPGHETVMLTLFDEANSTTTITNITPLSRNHSVPHSSVPIVIKSEATSGVNSTSTSFTPARTMSIMDVGTGNYFEDLPTDGDIIIEAPGNSDDDVEEQPVGFEYNPEPAKEYKTEIGGGIATAERIGSTVQVKIEAKNYVEEMKKQRKKYSKSSLVFDSMGNPIRADEPRRTCNICGKVLHNHSNLLVHMRSHTKEAPYECPTCGKRFSVKSNYNRHLLIHAGIKSYQCDICYKTFGEKKSMETHRRTHTGEKPYQCHMCGERFAQLSTLAYHQLTHTGEKPHACEICGKAFRQSGAMKVHSRRHNPQRDFPCSRCNLRFITHREQMRHEQTHEDDKQNITTQDPGILYQCSQCNLDFPSIEKLSVHQAKYCHDLSKNPDAVPCEKCNIKFIDKASLAMHMVEVHQELNEALQQELLGGEDTEIYTMDDDGTLQPLILRDTTSQDTAEQDTAEQDTEEPVTAEQVTVEPDTAEQDTEESIQVVYMDTESQSLSTVDGKQYVVRERNGQMELVEEDEVKELTDVVVFKPAGNKS